MLPSTNVIEIKGIGKPHRNALIKSPLWIPKGMHKPFTTNKGSSTELLFPNNLFTLVCSSCEDEQPVPRPLNVNVLDPRLLS